eukprot:gene13544-18168_t
MDSIECTAGKRLHTNILENSSVKRHVPNPMLVSFRSAHVIDLISDEEDFVLTQFESPVQDLLFQNEKMKNNKNNDQIDESDETEINDVDDYREALCLICDLSLANMDDESRDDHIRVCFDQYIFLRSNCGDDLTQLSQITQHLDDQGLKAKHFNCVVCDLDLSRRQLSSRCQHMKKCAKSNCISTKDLLQMIAPIDGIDEIVEINSDEENDILAEINENKQINVKDKIIPRNAWTVMMESSKSVFSSSTKSGFLNNKDKGKKNLKNSSFSKGVTVGSSKSLDQIIAVEPPQFHNSNYAPAFKKIQVGNMKVPIIVDGFQYAQKGLSDCYFLTHFHYDHYIGLSKSFSFGNIFCSVTTAALVKLKLNLNSGIVIPMELERKYTIKVGGEDVDVTLMDANHCPGAVCILFKFKNGKEVLHTGDFRWSATTMLRNSQTFRSLVSNANNIKSRNLTAYLDTTYCDINYNFPQQDIA